MKDELSKGEMMLIAAFLISLVDIIFGFIVFIVGVFILAVDYINKQNKGDTDV